MYLIYKTEDEPVQRCAVCLSGTPSWYMWNDDNDAWSCDDHLHVVLRNMKVKTNMIVAPFESISVKLPV